MTTTDGRETGERPAGAEVDWYRLEADEVLDRLETDEAGLDDSEVARRRGRWGPNRLREQEEVSAWQVFLDQLASPLVYVLLGALVVTLAIGNYADAIVVAAVLVINTTVGFYQEYRAQSAVQSLMDLVSPTATVRRSGGDRQIDAEDLVPGDVVLLGQGGVVPADVRLLETAGLRVDEAALTGESVQADKTNETIDDEHLPPADQNDMAFMGTALTAGEGVGVVVATGSTTEIGRISEQVEEARGTETPLEQRIGRLATWITVLILAIAAVTFLIGLLIGRSVTEMLLLAVALAVSAIPAGLPVVVTVALAIGVNRMSRRHALIRQLAAVDTLGSTTTIISDKTGTLTENRMTVRSIVAGGQRYDYRHAEGDRRLADDDGDVDVGSRSALRDALLVGALCNDATLGDDDESPSGDPMEVALLEAARDAGMDRASLEQRFPRRDVVPFRTERRYMATINDETKDGARTSGPLVFVKGAPERIVEMCSRRRTADGEQRELDREDVLRTSESLASEGLRVLAMAMGDGEDAAAEVRDGDARDLTFVGLHGLLDPARESAVDAVDSCHMAGIRVVMVTGDHTTTAAAIGEQVHIGRSSGQTDGRQESEEGDVGIAVRTGQDVAELSDDDLDGVLADVNVFARVAPEQKLRLVDRLKAADEVVAVTGDGVNDAPALQSAHIGAAMGSGTDVAKEASEMVITDDNFASVYAAVEEGRTAFRNIRMATFFLLSTGAAEVVIILYALGAGWPLPLLPAQILWLNVVTNGIADVALAFEPGEKALFRRRPRPLSEGILDRVLIERLVIVGAWLAAGTLAVFYWKWAIQGTDLVDARSAALTAMVLFQKVHVFNCRSEDTSIFRKSLFSNKVLFMGVMASLIIHVGALYFPVTQQLLGVAPLPATTWFVLIAIALTAVVVNEAHKRLRPREGSTLTEANEPEGSPTA